MSRRFINLTVLLSFAAILFAGCTTIGPGHEGIVINKLGDNRGADQIPLQTGWIWFNPIAKQIVEYPTFVQTLE